MIPEEPATRKSSRKAKKDLLRLEKPIYQLKRNQEGQPEAIIAKLLERKEKPQIGFLPRSQLLEQLDRFIPVLKQSNQQLLRQEIKPEMQFDAKLEQVEDSSSSEEEEEEGEEAGEGAMEVEGGEAQAQKPAFLQSVEEFQFNILKYPYLPKEEPSNETKQEQRPSVHSIVSQTLATKFSSIVQIGSSEAAANHLEELQ